MLRILTLLVLVLAVVAGIFIVLSKGTSLVTGRDGRQAGKSGNSMQRLPFFLLLALIAYVAASGVS